MIYVSFLWITSNPFYFRQKNPICPNTGKKKKNQHYLLQGKNKTVGRRSTMNSQGRSFWDTSILVKGKNRKCKSGPRNSNLEPESLFSSNLRTRSAVCATQTGPWQCAHHWQAQRTRETPRLSGQTTAHLTRWGQCSGVLLFLWCGQFLSLLLNLLQYCFCFMFWFFGQEACRSLAPRPRIKPAPPALEGEV